MWSIECGGDGRRPGRSPFPTEQLASAAAVVDRTGLDRFVHDPADGAGATAAFGTAAQAPVDFAGAARRAFGRDRPDLMVGNHVARTHDHGGTPCSDRPCGLLISANGRANPDTSMFLPRRKTAAQAL